MCGIAGYIGPALTNEADVASRMRAAIRYRGRDAEGEWGVPGEVRLFHSRLKVIDLEGGAQPMEDAAGDRVIVFNGEIYNYLELRRQYKKLGATFRTRSDTEVLLAGFGLKGAAMLEDLIGMFAFAIWDRRSRELFLARDRLGKKPLYWLETGGGFYFSSSIDAFSSVPGWRAELSPVCMDFYAAVGSFPLGRTAYKQARAVPPGCYAIVGPGRAPELRRYWRMNFARKRRISLESALEEYESILTDAVRIRLRADVPVALTFSGGVDSGTIAGIATTKLNRRLGCFTIDYDAPDDRSEETAIARQVALHFGLDWRFLHFDYRNELLAAVDEALQVVDQPCNHIAISYSQRLYEVIKPYATVVLTGNGADELFLGYAGNEDLLRKEISGRGSGFQRAIRMLSRLLRGKSDPIPNLAQFQCNYVGANLVAREEHLQPEEIVSELKSEIEAAGISTYADLYTFMSLTFYTCDANFRLPDIAGLRAQVEVRSPFLDHRMVEFAATLPSEFKIGCVSDSARNKLLPKLYYERLVPGDIAWSGKKGMGFNLRYGESFATDPRFQRAYDEALASIEATGIDAERFRGAWQDFVRDKSLGVRYPASAGRMMAGFMLGRWLCTGRVRVSPGLRVA